MQDSGSQSESSSELGSGVGESGEDVGTAVSSVTGAPGVAGGPQSVAVIVTVMKDMKGIGTMPVGTEVSIGEIIEAVGAGGKEDSAGAVGLIGAVGSAGAVGSVVDVLGAGS